MVEHKPVTQPSMVGSNLPAGVDTLNQQHLVEPGTTKVHFQNPQTETAYQGIQGIKEGVPPSNEAVIIGIEQAKQSILSSQTLLSREGKTIQRDTLILLDLIKMIIEDRNSDQKMQQFLVCFRNLSQKYAPEFGDDLRYGVKRGYESSQKGSGRDLYNSIIGLRDFVFQLIKSADFREAIGEFFQYIQILAGEVNIDDKGTGGAILSKLASGIKSMAVEESPSSSSSGVHEHPTTSEVVSSVGGGSLNLQHKQEESLLPSQVSSESELKKNQGVLSEPGQFSQQQQFGQQQLGQQQMQQPLLMSGQQQSPSSFVGSDTSAQKRDQWQEQQQPISSQSGIQQQQWQQPSQQWQSGSSGISRQQSELQPSSGMMGNVPQQSSFDRQQPLSSSMQTGQQWQSGSSGISQQQPLQSELKPSSLYGTTHQGVSPMMSSTQQQQQWEPSQQSPLGHYPTQNIVDDQYREPSEHSNVQAQQFRPVGMSQQQQPLQSGISSQQQQPWSQQQGYSQSGIPPIPQQQQQSFGQQQPLRSSYNQPHITKSSVHVPQQGAEKNRKEIEDSLIDRYVQLNKRFSKDPNYQRALFGLFSLFNEVKGLFGDTPTQGGEKTKTVERLKEDEDFKSLLNYAKLIIYEFGDKTLFDKWMDSTNSFFIHLKTDERLKMVLREMMNDFRRYGKEPTLLESKQEKENLRTRLADFRTVFEEKKNMDLTNDMLTYGRELLVSMRNDELNAELRERSQKLMTHLFLDEHGKFQLKPSALEQIRTILFVAIQEAINNWNTIEVEGDDGSQYFKISNITLKANDILPDDVKFKVKNRTSMKYEELNPTDRLAESATLIGAHLFGMTAHLKDVGFMFDRRSFPSISDRGVMDIDFDRGGISVKLKLKARLSQNRPFYVKGIGVSVDTLHIKFKQAEKHKLMLKMLSPIIQNRVRRKIHDNLEVALNSNIKELIERLNDLIEQTIVQGNVMAGQGEHGGMLTGIMGRMGISTQPETLSDYPHEGGEYLSQRSSKDVVHSKPVVQPVVQSRPVAQPVVGQQAVVTEKTKIKD